MTYRTGVWVFGPLIVIVFIGDLYAGFANTVAGTLLWLFGLLLLAILSPLWGFCLGRVCSARGDRRLL